jgi:hypothetical protein
MPGPLLNLQLSQDAEEQLSTLGEADRRRLSGWFERLREWNNDTSLHELAYPVPTYPEELVFRTPGDWVISFRLVDDAIEITSIFRKRSLRAFEAASKGSP